MQGDCDGIARLVGERHVVEGLRMRGDCDRLDGLVREGLLCWDDAPDTVQLTPAGLRALRGQAS
jgi:hypothetical protein